MYGRPCERRVCDRDGGADLKALGGDRHVVLMRAEVTARREGAREIVDGPCVRARREARVQGWACILAVVGHVGLKVHRLGGRDLYASVTFPSESFRDEKKDEKNRLMSLVAAAT